jgi:TPP-dependent 2-oxoacid decarboxylase
MLGQHLIQRLARHGVGHVFGIPGDYVLGFYEQLRQSPLKTITTCDEQGAGFAADAYARIRGLGVVCITYCVGGLKVVNTTAEAFAEKSAVVVISGAPGVGERAKNPLLHHKVRDFETQRRVFEEVTVAHAVLDNPDTALGEIDRVLHAALRYRRPVYLELPRDMVNVPVREDGPRITFAEASEPDALAEALAEATAMIKSARQPVIVADVELQRFGLQEELVRFAEKTGIPVTATILGKSVISEQHPLFAGIYEGAMGREATRQYVEESDCVILLGFFMTDINLGIGSAKLDPAKCIYATSEKLSIRHHSFEGVRFKDFVNGLIDAPLPRRDAKGYPVVSKPGPDLAAPTQDKLTITRLFERLNAFLTDDTVVIADVGNALFGAGDLTIHRHTEFLAPAYYASMGFAVPAALGAQLANPTQRPLVLVGDGAFQMTGLELSTIVRYGLNPIVVVLNNAGYGTERHMHDGPFNDVLPWRYHRLPDLLGAGVGFEVTTEAQLVQALVAAKAHTSSYCLLDVRLDPMDHSPALRRLAEGLAAKL